MSEHSTWVLDYNSEELTIKNYYDSSRRLQYNSSNPRFACYTSNQKPVALYKKFKETTIDEDKDYDSSQSGVSDVVLKRTISSTNINTLVLPFDMSAEEFYQFFGEGSKVYVVGEYQESNDHITLVESSEGILANQPVLLKATNAGTSYTISNRELVAANTATPTARSDDGVEFVGVYTFGADVPVGSYLVSSNQFRKVAVAGAGKLKNTRAYFTLPSGSETKSITFTFNDGETTGIAIVEDGELDFVSGKIYDLSGREVKNPSRGIYIINGKKVVIK